jgi:hypothetical protein
VKKPSWNRKSTSEIHTLRTDSDARKNNLIASAI